MSLECLKKSQQFERALAVQIIMLAPLAPHFASELWAAFCSAKHHLISESEVQLDKDVMDQDWPEIDMDYKMVLNFIVSSITRISCINCLLKYSHVLVIRYIILNIIR